MDRCKECGKELINFEDMGSNKDGRVNKDYCNGCFRSGIFSHFK